MIESFTGENRFLSNFYQSDITVEDKVYPTVEHFYQSKKASNSKDAELIRTAKTPGLAKKLGRQIKLRSGWEAMKVNVMLVGLTLKFEDPTLRAMLMRTHPHSLIEGNDWGDEIWGMDNTSQTGQNLLGILLMLIRAENILKDIRRLGK